jgi:septal ring factor EnvC (AmiA/AmiB activator)
MKQNQQLVEVITVKPDEFYLWVKKQISEKKLPITIKSKLPEKYTAPVLVQAVPLFQNATLNKPHVGQIYSNPSPDQRLIMQLDEQIFKGSKRISFLEEENDKFKNQIAKLEKEIAEAKPKAEKWDDWNNKKRKH